MKRLYAGIISASAFFCSTQIAQACEKINSFYLDPEVVLLSKYRNYGIKIIDARAVKSNEYKSIYFVQYKIKHPTLGVVYPVFGMNKPFSMGSSIFSMDDLALEISGYGDGRTTKEGFSKFSDGYSRVLNCLK